MHRATVGDAVQLKAAAERGNRVRVPLARVEVRRAGLGGFNSDRSGSWRHSGRDLAAEAVKGSPKRPEGTERRRARGATHTMFRRTRAQKIIENVTYVEHLQND